MIPIAMMAAEGTFLALIISQSRPANTLVRDCVALKNVLATALSFESVTREESHKGGSVCSVKNYRRVGSRRRHLWKY